MWSALKEVRDVINSGGSLENLSLKVVQHLLLERPESEKPMEVADVEEEAILFFHEGSELLSDLKDQLAALPELKDLSPYELLGKHHKSLLGDGNGVPTPARDVVSAQDVSGAKSIAQMSRQVPQHQLQIINDLLKKQSETKLIEYSDSEWASPIVIVMKRTEWTSDSIGFENVMWLLSLDMASGIWAVPMTHSAQHISAFGAP
ncbi:hypothetical protein PHMEG_00029508 [Phytophthora megakarya]|uniref:Reverse transcriptase n=1 Tax=Phytophthora megakarya TaxID=4795 RepID=A0A225V2H1_9STRA|nr:hypothetical protein PHMEG_00029508 [Phytophthora megakarya]